MLHFHHLTEHLFLLYAKGNEMTMGKEGSWGCFLMPFGVWKIIKQLLLVEYNDSNYRK